MNHGGKVVYVRRPSNDPSYPNKVQGVSKDAFEAFYADRYVLTEQDGDLMKVYPAKRFLEEAERKSHIIFDPPPCETSPAALNLWRGFENEGKPSTSCATIKELLHTVIFNGDDDAFDCLWKWLAHLVQRPGEKPGTTLQNPDYQSGA